MEFSNDAPLFDPSAAQSVLGYLMYNPAVLMDTDRYIITTNDFICNKFYVILFGAIYNLVYEGAKHIHSTQLLVYLQRFPEQYEFIESENGVELTKLIYESGADIDDSFFLIQYNRVKKLTTLRDLRSKGIDVHKLLLELCKGAEINEQLNKITINDILTAVRNKVQLVENNNVRKQETTGQYAAVGLKELVKSFKANPEVGIPLEGTIVNYATRGCRKGKMYLYSAPSGGGKTRTMVGNACSLAFPRIENGKIVRREQLEPVLFIATEMDATEIQTLILAWISGVQEEKILMPDMMTPDEEDLVVIACNIVEKYSKNFIIESIPNPSINSLKALITNYIIEDEINYVFYDYIFSSVGLVEEFRSVNLREDVVLMMLSNTLKEIAATYNVFMMSGTQLNGSWEDKQVRNANMLRGRSRNCLNTFLPVITGVYRNIC